MGKKKTRVEVHHEREALTDNPFAALADGSGTPSPEPAKQSPPTGDTAWSVGRTRKGGWPLRMEKRAGGKSATIIGNVQGDGVALLKAMKKVCAAGGRHSDTEVEIQGDHVDRIARYLDGCGGCG